MKTPEDTLTQAEALDTLNAIIAQPVTDQDHPWEWRQYDAVAIALASLLEELGYHLHCVGVVARADTLYVALNGQKLPTDAEVEKACQSLKWDEKSLARSWSSQDTGSFRETIVKLQKGRAVKQGRAPEWLYRKALQEYAQRQKVKLAQREFPQKLQKIEVVPSPNGVHAEMSLLRRMHELMPAVARLDDRSALYFGNNKLNCAKCEWYFGHYAGWPGSRFIPLSRGYHALAVKTWQEPDIAELNKWLSPGLSFVRGFSNVSSGMTVFQDLIDDASDSEPETEEPTVRSKEEQPGMFPS